MVDDAVGTERSSEQASGATRRLRLMVFAVLAVLWLGFIAFGQVRARFWIRNEFRIEWKSVTSIWRVALGELPGGIAIQAFVLISAATIVCGIVGCLYLMLVSTEDAKNPAQDIS